jgi:hypothetical protein
MEKGVSARRAGREHLPKFDDTSPKVIHKTDLYVWEKPPEAR